MYFKENKGFTLIELLVVIAVIGLLASVILVSLNSARLKARDSKRIADLKQLNTALNLYYANSNDQYPVCGTAMSTDADWNTTGCLITALKPYLSKLPVDPTNNTVSGTSYPWLPGFYGYTYLLSPTGKDYDLVDQVEDPKNQDACSVKQWHYHYYDYPPYFSTCNGAPCNWVWCNVGGTPTTINDH